MRMVMFDIGGTLLQTMRVSTLCFVRALEESICFQAIDKNWAGCRDMTEQGHMNEVFEKFVFKLFYKFYPLQSKEQQRFAAWEIESTGKKYNIIPDILIFGENRHEIKTIIDTKYKDEISEADRYQIAFYMRDYDKKEGYAILSKTLNSYPETLKAPRQNIEIKIRYIDIDDVLTLIYSNQNNEGEIKDLLLEIIPQ